MGVLCIVVATEMLAIDKYIGDCLLPCIRAQGALHEPTILHGVYLVHDNVDARHRLEEGLGASAVRAVRLAEDDDLVGVDFLLYELEILGLGHGCVLWDPMQSQGSASRCSMAFIMVNGGSTTTKSSSSGNSVRVLNLNV